jgi:hypothetical protein
MNLIVLFHLRIVCYHLLHLGLALVYSLSGILLVLSEIIIGYGIDSND